jgi:hypothetical protein
MTLLRPVHPPTNMSGEPYFRHAVAKHTFHMLDAFTWRRLIRMLMARHRWNWTAIHFTRRAAWRNGPAATPALRSRPTHLVSCE